jgi:predicted ATP-dependent endonuclease of OLD family
LLHLVFIEEPEAHLHMQLQQVFIRKVLEIVTVDGEDAEFATSQVVVTTHSSHIVYERGFIPVRYFRRSGDGVGQQSDIPMPFAPAETQESQVLQRLGSSDYQPWHHIDRTDFLVLGPEQRA